MVLTKAGLLESLLNEFGWHHREARDVVDVFVEEKRSSQRVDDGSGDVDRSGGWVWDRALTAALLPPRSYRRALTAALLPTAKQRALTHRTHRTLTHRTLKHRAHRALNHHTHCTLSHRALSHQGEFSRGRVKTVGIDVAIRPSGRVWRRRQWPTAAPLNPGPPGNKAPVFTSGTTATVHANQTAACTAVATARRRREFGEENRTLRHLLAEAELDKAAIKEVIKGPVTARHRRRAVAPLKAQRISERRARLKALAERYPRYGYPTLHDFSVAACAYPIQFFKA